VALFALFFHFFSVFHARDVSCPADVELLGLTTLSHNLKELDQKYKQLNDAWSHIHHGAEEVVADKIAKEIMPLVEKITAECNLLEDMTPESQWPLPSYFDLLSLR
jgi:glutamine synthetase type III